jgi:hypothetical protein
MFRFMTPDSRLMRLRCLGPLHRPCSAPAFPIRRISTQLTVTDPLVLYQNLVDGNSLRADESQFRAAVEFDPRLFRIDD